METPPAGFESVSEKPQCPEDGGYILHGGDNDLMMCSYKCSSDVNCVGIALYDAADVGATCDVSIPCNNFDFQGKVYGKTILLFPS